MKMLTFEQIRKSFADQFLDYQTAKKALYDEIAKNHEQPGRLLVMRNNVPSIPYWTESLLRPMINLIKPHFSDWKCDDERLYPMGLCSKVPVLFFHPYDRKKYIYIVFESGDLSKGELLYETDQIDNEFPKKLSGGEIKGFNRISKAVESIEELVYFLKKQIIKE